MTKEDVQKEFLKRNKHVCIDSPSAAFIIQDAIDFTWDACLNRVCKWRYKKTGYYVTGCENVGAFKYSKATHCHFCGGKIEEE
jgi:hypothetical protein